MTARKTTSKTAKKTTGKRKAKAVTATNTREAKKTSKLVERQGISLWNPAAIISTVFSVGRIPYAPGTWGSLVGVVYFPVFLLLPLYVGVNTDQILLVAIVALGLLTLLYCIGVLAVKSYQSKTKTSDASEIVYDEFFGQILTYSIISAFAVYMSLSQGLEFKASDQTHALIYEFVPFVFFRLFDICKPWPINIVDAKENSAWGVMFDDVLAAFYAAAASIVVFLVLDNYI